MNRIHLLLLLHITVAVGQLLWSPFLSFFLFFEAHTQAGFSQKAHRIGPWEGSWRGRWGGGHGRFSWLDSVLLIAADLGKLGTRAAERLLASPAFPHSHFQRFQRVWSADWWRRTAGARGNRVIRAPTPSPTHLSLYHSLPLSHSGFNESVMGLLPLLFIAGTD